MTPPDGSDFPLTEAQAGTEAAPARLTAALAVVLPGGRSLVAFEAREAEPPRAGRLGRGGRRGAWLAECWPRAGGEGWAGLALIDGPLAEPLEVEAEDGARWRLTPAARLDVAPEPLADFVRAAGLPGRDVIEFLTERLLGGAEALPDGGRMLRDFAAGFITAAAEADGFIEILASPEHGGFFAQGWSLSLGEGPTLLARVEGGLAVTEAEVAVFARADILPPGHGFCLFCRDWRGVEPGKVGPVFFERDGKLRRLDPVRGAAIELSPEKATAHVAHMLPRLEGDRLGAFKRICRPRYQGEDTLSGTKAPVAAAFDAVFQAPDGAILAMGWLLDPLARVERALIKGPSLYAPLQLEWHPIARPDLNAGFAADPRFARLLDDRDVMHGFIAYAPGRGAPEEGETYLELVLDDNTCLFRPQPVTRLENRDRVPQILAAVPSADPGVDQMVAGALAPFLSALPAVRRPTRAGGRPIPLGAGRPRDIAAVMPFRSLAQLQPVAALLAGAPEAEALELVLVTQRSAAQGLPERLAEMFRFYGLAGRLVLTPEGESFAAQVEAGVAATQAQRLLVWSPSALPTAPGWLAGLLAAQAGLETPGLVSPALIYEDGSIYYGGGDGRGGMVGYGAAWLAAGLRPAAAGAAEIALIDRLSLARAGGFSGGLLGDALGHRDLAGRLKAAGGGAWCASGVRFWMLQDEGRESQDPRIRLLRKIDAALVSPGPAPGVPARSAGLPAA